MTRTTIQESQLQKFAAVYAEAVLTFLDSGEPQWVAWDGHSTRFESGSMEVADPTIPAMLFVDPNWPQVVGDVAEEIDPDTPGFDAEALRRAIEVQILDEGYGERLLKGFQERLAMLASGELEPDPTEPEERDDI